MPDGPELPVPMPFPALLDEAVNRTRRALPAIYLPFALAVAVIAATSETVQLVVRNSLGAATDPAHVMVAGCSAVLLLIPQVLLTQILTTAMVYAAVAVLCGDRPVFGRSLRFAVRPGVLGATVLTALCVVASMMACLLPVLFVAPLLGLVAPAMAVEGLTGTDALRRSARLTRYNPQGTLLASPRLKLLALYLLVVVASFMVNGLTELPLLIAQRGSILRRLAAGENIQQTFTTWAQVPLLAVQGLIATPIQLFASFATALFFFDLRARREGDDLRHAIAELTAGLDPGPPLPPLPAQPLPPSPPSLPILLP